MLNQYAHIDIASACYKLCLTVISDNEDSGMSIYQNTELRKDVKDIRRGRGGSE